jgi:hypothetical protein
MTNADRLVVSLTDRGAEKKGLREPAQAFFFNLCRVGQIPPNRLITWIP